MNDVGPYKWQRDRQLGNKQPRPPQPAYQPNQLPPVQGWGGTTQDYWQTVFSEYLRRRKSTTNLTNLGGLK